MFRNLWDIKKCVLRLIPLLHTVKHRFRLFKTGRESIDDDDVVEATTLEINSQWRLKKKQLSQMVGESDTTVLNILYNHLEGQCQLDSVNLIYTRQIGKICEVVEDILRNYRTVFENSFTDRKPRYF